MRRKNCFIKRKHHLFKGKYTYGYRDEEYFHLKIYDLPEIKTQKELQQLCNKTQKRLKNGTANTKTLEIQTLIEYCFYYSRLPMKKTFFGGNGNATFCRFCGIYSKRYFTEINPQILVKTQKKKQLNHDYCGSTAYSVFINWPN